MKKLIRMLSFVAMLSGIAGVVNAAAPLSPVVNQNPPQNYVQAAPAPGDYVVTDEGARSLFAVTPSGMVTTIAGGFATPVGAAVDRTGDFIVADFSAGILYRVTPAGVITAVAVNLGDISGVAIDANGNYITNSYTAGNVYSITPAGVVTTIATGAGMPFNAPAVDGNGDIIVTSYGTASLLRVTSRGVVTKIAAGAPLVNPNGVVIDAAGDFIVSDRGAAAIFRITRAGVISTIASIATPDGIAMDGNGNFIVPTSTAGTVSKVTPAGAVTTIAKGTPLLTPNGAAVVPASPTAFRISPATGMLATTQVFDLVLAVEGGASTLVSATIDGRDVSRQLARCLIPGTVIPPSPGGSTLSCRINGATIGAGTHTFSATVSVNGRQYSNAVTWDVLNATQP